MFLQDGFVFDLLAILHLAIVDADIGMVKRGPAPLPGRLPHQLAYLPGKGIDIIADAALTGMHAVDERHRECLNVLLPPGQVFESP